MIRAFAALLLCTALSTANAVPRSQKARHDFARTQACPSTGKHKLPCPGYIIDHVAPLCAGGEDAPRNMQWQTKAEALEKDKEERRQCRR